MRLTIWTASSNGVEIRSIVTCSQREAESFYAEAKDENLDVAVREANARDIIGMISSVLCFILAIAVVLTVIGGVVAGVTAIVRAAKTSMVFWDVDTYVVRSGDTYWTIAGKLGVSENDIPEWCDRVEGMNANNPHSLQPGDVIKVLVPPTED